MDDAPTHLITGLALDPGLDPGWDFDLGAELELELDVELDAVTNLAREVSQRPAQQQPPWQDRVAVSLVRQELAARPALVTAGEVRQLQTRLADVAAGRAEVVQAGDCAEDPGECSASDVTEKVALLDVLAGVLQMTTGRPAVRVGRIAGQYAKPRSSDVERIGDLELPAYRGHLVNGPEPDPSARRADPWRMLTCHGAAGAVIRHLPPTSADAPHPGMGVWTSHEALALDYELPLVRRTPEGDLLLTSTHWPWIGDRTRQADGAHVALLSQVVNPVACKVGPGITAGDLLRLCDRLDPYRCPGRLTLIARMGAGRVRERLPGLVASVRAAGHPVIWLCDPMHANTVASPAGVKTRTLTALVDEVRGFLAAVRDVGGRPGGLHLETTPHDVTECVADQDAVAGVARPSGSLCDPRLNPEQAVTVVGAWT